MDTLTEIKEKKERKEAIRKKHGYKFIRINPDEKDYDEYAKCNEVNSHTNESNKKLTEESTKKSLTDKISRRLLQLEFKSNHSIKSKCLKRIVKKILPSL